MRLREKPETQANDAVGTVWQWMWPLLFVCTMAALSLATQRYSGYIDPGIEARASQPSPAVTR